MTRAVRRFGGLAVGVAGLLTAQPLNRLTAQSDAASPTIDSIIIENKNVFDRTGDAPDWVAHVANALHIRTRQWVIRRRLLVNRGDPFDRARMEESERALRTLGVFRSVRVDTVRSPVDGKLVIRAVTADGWSTQPQASFTSVGGDKTWEVGFIERNFLGTATEVALKYGRNPDRRRLDFQFVNPNFVGRRTLLSARYSDLSDGNRGDWEFGLNTSIWKYIGLYSGHAQRAFPRVSARPPWTGGAAEPGSRRRTRGEQPPSSISVRADGWRRAARQHAYVYACMGRVGVAA